MEAVQAPRATNRSHLRRYREVCQLTAADSVPLTYPHVLAAPAQLALLSSKAFPLRLLGLVHLRNEIVQYASISVSDRLALRISAGGHRDTDMGQEFDIVTRVTRGDELVWLETSTALARTPREERQQRAGRSGSKASAPGGKHVSWQAAEDAGRKYARVSGDYNPIHLFGATARWFGFRQPIAHGMWTLARCLGELEKDCPDGRCSVRTVFGKPFYLPGWSVLTSESDGANSALPTLRSGVQARLSQRDDRTILSGYSRRPSTGFRSKDSTRPGDPPGGSDRPHHRLDDEKSAHAGSLQPAAGATKPAAPKIQRVARSTNPSSEGGERPGRCLRRLVRDRYQVPDSVT